MHRLLKVFATTLTCCLVLVINSCNSSSHGPQEKYYLVATNIKIPYWQAAAAGLAKVATDIKVTTQITGPETYNPQAQREEFARIVAMKPAGILLSPADPGLLKEDIDKAIAAGVPVITMDSDAPATQRVMFIGTNNYQAGLIGGRVLIKQLQGKGNVVVFTIPAQENLEERLRGYKDALVSSPHISIVQVVDIRGDSALAFDKTVEIVDAGKLKIDAFVCLEATACKEVAEVLNRKKSTGKVVIAMDTEQGTLEWIEKGVIAATIAQRPYTMAYYGVKMLDDLHHHKPAAGGNWRQNLTSPIPAIIDTGASLVDKSNLAEIRNTAK
ncbi:MAG: substrate-binding domain-containing protein [Bryobacteraceae bacterium]